MSKDAEKQNRAVLAQQVLDNPVFKESWLKVRATYIEALTNTKPSDTERLQELAMYLKNLERLEKTFLSCVNTGKVVEHKAERKLKLFNL